MKKTGIGAVVIGRNEGERLIRCLSSINEQVDNIVYVDSGSTDDSLANARDAGAKVVELDLSTPFTAARARNAGLAALCADKNIVYVQFVDGDCEMQSRWIGTAYQFLEQNAKVAVACGRRRERFPDASVYNRLCDREWDTPIGQTKACGGDALMRVAALQDVGGYNATLIAGEEPELCVRLRAKGWEVWRLDHEMTLHDAAITRFAQWWRRAIRSGHAYAEGAALHGAHPERHSVNETMRAVFWGLILPVMTFLLMLLITPWACLLLLVYPMQVLRMAFRDGPFQRENWEQAFYMTAIKFPEVQGVLSYVRTRLLRRRSTLIEYK